MKQYWIVREQGQPSGPGIASSDYSQVKSNRNNAARTAVERAVRDREEIAIIASHWPNTGYQGDETRPYAVKVGSHDLLEDVIAEIERLDQEAGN